MMFSIWERTSFHQTPDLAVIGAGIVGLFTVLHYKRRFPHHQVIVLERGPHPSGASVKNAGFACFGSPSEILADIDAEGTDVALARVEERWLGLRELRAELGDAHIGFEASGGHELYAANDPLYTRVVDRFDELDSALRGIFGRSVYEWYDERKGDLGLRTDHIAFTDLEGPLDTGMMMRALLSKVSAEDVAIHFNCEVVACEETATSAMIRMKDGSVINAARAVIATNGYARELLTSIDVVPARGQVLLTSPIEGLKLKGTFHINEGYYYFRDYQGCVLLGGGRQLDKSGETTTEDAVTPLIQDALEKLLREVIIPDRAFSIDQRWSGVMGFRSRGKSPLIERISPHVVAAVGLGGMGVAIGIRVAKKAAELVGE